MPDVQTLEKWMLEAEGENLEFKAARNRYGLDELTEYCVAIANEGGGKIILGVSDKRPRQVVGSSAFLQPEQTRGQLNQRLHLGISFEIVSHPNGRVLIFHVPSRPLGIPIQFKGKFLVRKDESLVGMSGERLLKIYAESGRDYSAEICDGLVVDDLVDHAVEDFRKRWIARTNNEQLASLLKHQLLSDIEVITDAGVTYAGLILFGSRAAVRKYLAQAEFVIEYRSTNAAGPAAQREAFSEGFFLYFDRLWEFVNLRNDKQHYEDGAFILEVRTFQERIVREAILNAVSHRDYQLGGNNFMRQYPERIELDSPGGFAAGVTAANILHRHSPRNRRIAEVFEKCGLVEKAGQGVDLMYQLSIRDSKRTPDYSGSDDFTVCLALAGQMLNKQFVQFLLQCEQETLALLSTEQWLILDALSREEMLNNCSAQAIEQLLELGLIARAVRGRFILAKAYYELQNRTGTYQKMREREILKERLEAILIENKVQGTAIGDLENQTNELPRKQIRKLLEELKGESRAHMRGKTAAARWYPGEDGSAD